MKSGDMLALWGGRRASRGRPPNVVRRCRPRDYYLMVPGWRWVLHWSPWQGYSLVAWSRIKGGRVVEVGYNI